MNVVINKGKAKGTIIAPPSKSVAHRMLICGGLANAKSTITGINNSEDVQATLDCLAAIGVQYTHKGDVLEITGREVKKNKQIQEFFCRESGATLRFFIPLALLTGKKSIFYGTQNLLSRFTKVFARSKTLCLSRKRKELFLKVL